MKWKRFDPSSLIDTEKTVTKFAFWPTKVKEYTVWLETYEVRLRFSRKIGWSMSMGDCYYYYEWDEVERNTLEVYPC